jgi:ADP-heptose:LPS heptosyltransferase
MLLARTDLAVIVLADDAAEHSRYEASTASPQFRFVSERLTFEQLDALLSFCSAFVGNDSGPKHLASLRGAKVISLHSARTNWQEWGQEHSGVIISRRLPCAACMIYHDAEECGKDFVCISGIKPEEVFAAVLSTLNVEAELLPR